MAAPRRHAIAIVAIVGFAILVVLVGLVGAGTITIGPFSATTTTVPGAVDPMAKYLGVETKAIDGALSSLDVAVPAKPGRSAPSWTASPWRAPLAPHQVVGFVPWYELSAASATSSAPPSDFTQLVYSSLAVRPNGALVETPGPNNGGYDSIVNGGAAGLVARGHGAGDRVLLGLSTADQPTIDALTANPVAAGEKMAAQTIPLLSRLRFDGVDLDLEGQGASGRPGFVRLVAAFSAALRSADPSWTIMLNTYPNSAVDPSNFFDVRALSASVTDLFVMAYDMNDPQVPSATAPLQGIDVSDASTLAGYGAAGLDPKVILGVPFYGNDFTASEPAIGAATLGTPYSVSYTAVVQAGRPALWDPLSETAFSVFRRAGQWHQTWFDDPVSIALKTALAAQFHTAGVGAWELGMAMGQADMVEALLGGSPPQKLPLARQP